MMRVLFLQPQPCIRTLKYGYGFNNGIKENIDVIFAYTKRTLTEFYGHGDEFFGSFVKLESSDYTRQIRKLVRKHGIDFIHGHSAPDYLTVAAINADCAPVIQDVHDLFSIQRAKSRHFKEDYETDEKTACEKADAVVYVTDSIKDIVHEKYKVRTSKELVFHNYVPRHIIPETFKPKLSQKDGKHHVVYEGNLNSAVKDDHYDLREIFLELAGLGFEVHIYDARSNEDYRKLAESVRGLHYHGHLDPAELLYELTQYDFGWAGFNGTCHKEHLDTVLSNKILEYVAAGLPAISFPHKTQKEFIDKHGVGMVADTVDGLGSMVNDKERMNVIRSNVMKKRFDFTVESQINRVVDFYSDLN